MGRTIIEQNGDQNLLRILSAVLKDYRLPKPPEELVLGELCIRALGDMGID